MGDDLSYQKLLLLDGRGAKSQKNDEVVKTIKMAKEIVPTTIVTTTF